MGVKFNGVPLFTVRPLVIEELKRLGQYHGKKDNKMRLGICSRSKDIVEPVIRPQWWVATKNTALRAVAAGSWRSFLPSSKIFGISGWKTIRTGASLVNFGGVIEFRPIWSK